MPIPRSPNVPTERKSDFYIFFYPPGVPTERIFLTPHLDASLVDFFIFFYPPDVPTERNFLTSHQDVWLVEKIDHLFLRSVGTFGDIDEISA